MCACDAHVKLWGADENGGTLADPAVVTRDLAVGSEGDPDAVAVVAAVEAVMAPVGVGVAVSVGPGVFVEGDAGFGRVGEAVVHVPAFAGAVAGDVGRS